MAKLNFDELDDITATRILRFLNQAFRPEDITQLFTAKSSGEDYGIGKGTAKKIIEAKRELPRRRFTNLQELANIKGFGQDKLNELMAQFNISSAEKFRAGLYEKKILFDNFKVRFHTISFDTEEAFLAVVQDEERLRAAVAASLNELATPDVSPAALQVAKDQTTAAYVERFQESNIASYAFALWFYHFDQDNWFAYEKMRMEIEPFLLEAFNRKNKTNFALLKGVNNKNINLGGVTVTDLPLVLSLTEKAIFVFTAQLFD